MVSTIESPKAAIIYNCLLGLGLIEGAGVGLGLGDGVGVGAAEIAIAVLVSPKVTGLDDGFEDNVLYEKNIQAKTPRLINIRKIITILKIRLFISL